MNKALLIFGCVLLGLGIILLVLPNTPFQNAVELKSEDSFWNGDQHLRVYLEKGQLYRAAITAHISHPSERDRVQVTNVALGYVTAGPQSLHDGDNSFEFGAPYGGLHDVETWLNPLDTSRITVYKVNQSIPQSPFTVVGVALLIIGAIVMLGSTLKSPRHSQNKAPAVKQSSISMHASQA